MVLISVLQNMPVSLSGCNHTSAPYLLKLRLKAQWANPMFSLRLKFRTVYQASI